MKVPDQGKISGSQFMWLMVTTVLPTAVLFIPAFSIKAAGPSGWVDGAITATLWGLVIVRLCCSLGERFPERTLVDYSGDIVGKIPGKMIGIFYIFVFLLSNAIIVREFGEFLVSAFMPKTPMVVFNVILLLLAGSAVRNGIEVIARMNQFVVILMFFLLIFTFTLVLGSADIKHLFPLFEGGISSVLEGTLTPMGWRGEVFLLLMILPNLNNYREARVAGYKSVLLLGLVLGIDILMVLLVFGQQAANQVFPVHALATYISVAGFLERVEAFILGLWVAGLTVKVAIWFYCGAIATAQTFQLNDYKPVVLPLGVIQALWSISIFENIREMTDFFSGPWVSFSLVFEFVIPLILLVTAILRKKGGRPGAS